MAALRCGLDLETMDAALAKLLYGLFKDRPHYPGVTKHMLASHVCAVAPHAGQSMTHTRGIAFGRVIHACRACVQIMTVYKTLRQRWGLAVKVNAEESRPLGFQSLTTMLNIASLCNTPSIAYALIKGLNDNMYVRGSLDRSALALREYIYIYIWCAQVGLHITRYG